MSDEATTPETPATTVQETPSAETFSLDYVQQLRQEAAKYRNEKKTAVEEAVTKLSQEWEGKIAAKDVELTEVTTNASSKELELAKLRIALRALDPDIKMDEPSRAEKLAELLKGQDEESIMGSAKSALDLFGGSLKPSRAVDPTQGSGGGVLPLNGDPLLNALKGIVNK